MKEVLLRSRWLQDLEGSDLNQSLAITHFPAVVGRSSDCDYQICHPLISRRHCVFYLQDGEIWVRDLGSLNGTYLNGQRFCSPTRLNPGDQILMWNHPLVFLRKSDVPERGPAVQPTRVE